MGPALSITSIRVCASSLRRRRIVSPSSLLEATASIKVGSSRGANVHPIKRVQAVEIEKGESGVGWGNRHSVQDWRRRG